MKYKLFLLTLISLNACATSTVCHDLSTQSDMTNCSVSKLNALENKLNKRIADLSSILIEDKNYTLANKNWRSYRDAHCESVSNIYLGGSIYNFILSECKARQTQLRLEVIDNDYKDTVDIITKGSP